ncbi:hypothetical protein M422DRAFT_198890 [Sphaerobolus stellatus SS14]|nr:hypothetical protein M422DRAFT_198890 [Sphaerobolus stellatus SS14]
MLSYLAQLSKTLSDPKESSLTILARGLGIRILICTLLKVFDSPNSLILVVNATAEEENGIGQQLGVMGVRNPGLRVVDFEMTSKERQVLYRKGGLLSVTSRILTVDMLLADIEVEKITGIIVLHAEKVTALDSTAFITRLYREKNQTGFLKAFTDQPEQITSGMSPLTNILKELQVRTVHIYPRFHEQVQESLERRRADVIELSQEMSESMRDIHESIITCMNATLNELKRSNTSLDLDDLDIKAAYFRSFDLMVRRQLDPVWHKVGPRTKTLVNDLTVLRKLLTYLLTYDSLAFYAYLETIVASNRESGNDAYAEQRRSPWLTMDAAHTIFTVAKRRCYINNPVLQAAEKRGNRTEEDAGWEVLDELEGISRRRSDGQSSTKVDTRPIWEKEHGGRPWWLPKEVDPVLEEPPKWGLLADVLYEIETMINDNLSSSLQSGSNTVLVMTSSNRTCSLLREYLDRLDPSAAKGEQGHRMMMRRLRGYLDWKAALHSNAQTHANPSFNKTSTQSQPAAGSSASGESGLSEAMQKKDRERQARIANRRRMRGGASGSNATSQRTQASQQQGLMKNEGAVMEEAEQIADFLAKAPTTAEASSNVVDMIDFDGVEFDANYGLLPPEKTVVIRAYSDDTDDQVLAEIQSRFIVMYEPNQDFIRRIEVYRNSNPGLGVRIYFMFYSTSCEEHKYLAGLRREKESFERLIKERSSMVIPIHEQRRVGSDTSDVIVRTINTRIAGGGKTATAEPPQIIVDQREFRSTLPNLLHASNLKIIPATLVVGDYILTPTMCVERKSIPDLVSSFNSGRLYTQCELMCVHYKQPILLIEFEEHKSFSLETVSEMKSYVKPTGKYPIKKKQTDPSLPGEAPAFASIQSKLVLLTLTFPRVRVIWSSSPYATAQIFNDLKLNNPEPDLSTAVAVGVEDDANLGAGWNLAAEELLRTLPGMTAKNARYVMGKVSSISELCSLKLEQVQEILGVEPGKACWEFMHYGEKSYK